MSALPHTDIPADNWIDRWTPERIRPYLRLARLDRPIGTWLLLFPCWWSAALAASTKERHPDLVLMALFALGAMVMRGAGCAVNDILDRDIDALVERTRVRPIPSGQISARQAVVFLGFLLLLGLLILLQLNRLSIALGVGSLVLVFTYPLMKRVTWWPQAFLGLTFNWGAWMGWAAETGEIGTSAAWMYLAGIMWTLGYDTIYAHQDKEDDARIGVKSTALRLGENSRMYICGFYVATIAGLLISGLSAQRGWLFLVGLGAAAAQLTWQAATWDPDDPMDCLVKFKSNRWFGWLILIAMVL
ncbi:4-hydroxybenzoate octaprenyltransferase [Azospirillaceae bacterium]